MRRYIPLILILLLFGCWIGWFTYNLGKWVAHYNDSWMHIGDITWLRSIHVSILS